MALIKQYLIAYLLLVMFAPCLVLTAFLDILTALLLPPVYCAVSVFVVGPVFMLGVFYKTGLLEMAKKDLDKTK